MEKIPEYKVKPEKVNDSVFSLNISSFNYIFIVCMYINFNISIFNIKAMIEGYEAMKKLTDINDLFSLMKNVI